MAVTLTPCFRIFLIALSAPLRAYLRNLLYSIKKMIEIKIAMLKAIINRNDVIAATYKTAMDQMQSFLSPLESILSQLPLDRLDGCTEGTQVFSIIDDTYFEYKHKVEDLSYKYAQLGFASTYTNKAQEELENYLNKIDQMIDYLDNLAIGAIGIGTHVRVHSTGQTGTVTNITITLVSVNFDLGGSGTFNAGDVYPIS